MGRYDVVTKTDRAPDGTISQSGASWGETRPFMESICLKTAGGSVVSVLLGGFWSAATGEFSSVLGFSLLGLAGTVGLLIAAPANPRALYFHRDGRIAVPHGIGFHDNLTTIGGNHRDVVSIEARTQREQSRSQGDGSIQLYEVVMLFDSGDLVCVSRNLIEVVALKVAAQLTHSLSALRREGADALLPASIAWVGVS